MSDAPVASLPGEGALRLLVVAETAVQRAGLSALLNPVVQQVPVVSRTFDALRDIGQATGEAQHQRASMLASSIDVMLIVLDDAAVAIDEHVVRDGIAAIASLGVPVLLLLAETEQHVATVAGWLSQSVRGVLPLDAPQDELIAGVRAAAAGLTVIEPAVALALARSGARLSVAHRRASLAGDAAPALTNREREVLALLAVGHATKTIARDLGISSHTVKAHVESIFAKLGATTRAEAVAIGVRRGAVLL